MTPQTNTAIWQPPANFTEANERRVSINSAIQTLQAEIGTKKQWLDHYKVQSEIAKIGGRDAYLSALAAYDKAIKDFQAWSAGAHKRLAELNADVSRIKDWQTRHHPESFQNTEKLRRAIELLDELSSIRPLDEEESAVIQWMMQLT